MMNGLNNTLIKITNMRFVLIERKSERYEISYQKVNKKLEVKDEIELKNKIKNGDRYESLAERLKFIEKTNVSNETEQTIDYICNKFENIRSNEIDIRHYQALKGDNK